MDTPNKHLPRDVFLYLLLIVSLGMLAVNFGTLLFQYINIYLPDAIGGYYSNDAAYSTLRWALSSLVIVFPVFLWVSRFLNRDIKLNPEKRDLKIRKWILWLAVFIAALVSIGDLIALVYNFLQGELTLRFALKIISILAISSSVFYYYLSILKDKAESLKAFSRTAVAAVAVGLVAGFFIVGSPTNQRDVRFDQQRVNDLSSIQWQIVSRWQAKGALPADLSALTDSINGYKAPKDPVTGADYVYQTTGNASFRLCADFKTVSTDQGKNISYPRPVDSYGLNDNWSHPAGHYCFDRGPIDPALYPTNKPKPL